MEKDPNAQSGEILDDKKEKSKKKKSKVSEFISSRFAKLFSEREKPAGEADEEVEKKLSLKGRLLELIGVEADKPQAVETGEETNDEIRPVERIRSVLSSLNVFARRDEVDSPSTEVAPDDEKVLEELPELQLQSTEQESVSESGPSSSVIRDRSRETREEESNRTTARKESGTSFSYFDKHEREHRKQKKHNEKIEKELKKTKAEIDDIQKEHEELFQETEKTKREITNLEAQRTETRVAPPHESNDRISVVEPEATSSKQTKEQNNDQPDGNREDTRKPQEEIIPNKESDQFREEIVPQIQQSFVEKTPDMTKELPMALTENELPVEQSTKPEKERLIETIINPETKEAPLSSSARTRSSAATTTSSGVDSVDNKDQSKAVTGNPAMKFKDTNPRIEIVTILIVAASALVVFSLLAIVLMN